MAGACEGGNEPSDFIKCGEFLDYLRSGLLLKKESALWSKYEYAVLCKLVDPAERRFVE